MMTVNRFLEQRDADAALYLVSRMLGMKDEALRGHRRNLEDIQKRLSKKRRISDNDRDVIACTYREVVG